MLGAGHDHHNCLPWPPDPSPADRPTTPPSAHLSPATTPALSLSSTDTAYGRSGCRSGVRPRQASRTPPNLTTRSAGQWPPATSDGAHDGRLFTDLPVRVPGETTTSTEAGGALTIIYGDRDRLTATGSQTLTDGFSSEAFGIDVSWRRQLTAIHTGAHGLGQLIVGDEDWLRVVPTTTDGVSVTRHQKWTTKTLGHPEMWVGLADKVAG